MIDRANHLFDPNVLTLGFARRFATYKRPNLLLHDPERLIRLLTHPQRPVQLILAGKAHPADQAGQALIQEWMHFIRRPETLLHVIFLSDYDMHLTQHLVQGVDVWINTPRRPWEACGTSGMKVLVNGGINLSELDGWWAEAYAPDLGWALGDGQEHGDDPAWDAAEAEMLYDLLEREVVPEFYSRDEQGIPTAWIARMRESMARLTPRFCASRAVSEYTEQHYLPAAVAYHSRIADNSAKGIANSGLATQAGTEMDDAALRADEDGDQGEQHVYEVQVYLNDLDPDAVRVELCADGIQWQWSGTAGVAARPPAGGRIRRVCVQRGCTSGSPDGGLYGPTDTALRWSCNPAGRPHESCGSDNPIGTGNTIDSLPMERAADAVETEHLHLKIPGSHMCSYMTTWANTTFITGPSVPVLPLP